MQPSPDPANNTSRDHGSGAVWCELHDETDARIERLTFVTAPCDAVALAQHPSERAFPVRAVFWPSGVASKMVVCSAI